MTTGTEGKIRERILEVFESTRETPGKEYLSVRLIHYLVANPLGNGDVHSSFKGKRYFWRFIRRIEADFGVCFSNEDLNSITTLPEIAERVDYLLKTPRSSLTVASNRIRSSPNANLIIAIAVASIPIVAIGLKLFSSAGLLLLAIPIVSIILIVRSDRRERRHFIALRAQISGKVDQSTSLES